VSGPEHQKQTPQTTRPRAGQNQSRISGEHGFIDKKGEVVIKPKFDYPAYFKGDRALVYGGALSMPFYIDRSGEKVGRWSTTEHSGAKAPYGGEVVSEFSEDLAPVRYKGASFFEYLDSLPE